MCPLVHSVLWPPRFCYSCPYPVRHSLNRLVGSGSQVCLCPRDRRHLGISAGVFLPRSLEFEWSKAEKMGEGGGLISWSWETELSPAPQLSSICPICLASCAPSFPSMDPSVCLCCHRAPVQERRVTQSQPVSAPLSQRVTELQI